MSTIHEKIIAVLLASLASRERGEDIVRMAELLLEEMIVVSGMEHTLDIVGTGGDAYDTLNVSTMAAFVCAALGVPVAKHGNRAASSRCGSFDLLEKLGVHIPINPAEAKNEFKKNNLVFLYAPHFHPVLKAMREVRKALGIRTVFNFVGPLLHPANAQYQIIGVSSPYVVHAMGEAAMQLGRQRVLIIHSRDGLDEASISVPTDVYEYTRGSPMKHSVIHPPKIYPIKKIQGGTPDHNAQRFKAILAGSGTDAENEFVALNAGLGLYTIGKAKNIKAGRSMALEVLRSGIAKKIYE